MRQQVGGNPKFLSLHPPTALPHPRADSGHPLLQRAGPAAPTPGPLLPLQRVPHHPPLLPGRPLDPLPAARPHQPGPGRTRFGLSPQDQGVSPQNPAPAAPHCSWSSSKELSTPRRRPSPSPGAWWIIFGLPRNSTSAWCWHPPPGVRAPPPPRAPKTAPAAQAGCQAVVLSLGSSLAGPEGYSRGTARPGDWDGGGGVGCVLTPPLPPEPSLTSHR